MLNFIRHNQTLTTQPEEPMQEYRPTSSLKPHPLNAKIYRDASDTDLCDSVKRFGILQPILITEGGLIISGHRRWARLRQTTQKKCCRENPWGLSWKPRPGADTVGCSPMSLSMGKISILNWFARACHRITRNMAAAKNMTRRFGMLKNPLGNWD